MHFNVMEGGKSLNYQLLIDTFNLHAPKWPSVHEKMTPIVLYRCDINPVKEAVKKFQFKKKPVFQIILRTYKL